MSVKDGRMTSEYQEAKSASLWGIVAMVLGLILSVGTGLAEAFGGAESTVGMIIGAVVAVAGLIQQTLVKLGYINSRTEVKKADAARPRNNTGA